MIEILENSFSQNKMLSKHTLLWRTLEHFSILGIFCKPASSFMTEKVFVPKRGARPRRGRVDRAVLKGFGQNSKAKYFWYWTCQTKFPKCVKIWIFPYFHFYTLDLSDKIPKMRQNLNFPLFSLLYPRPIRQKSQNASKSEFFPILSYFHFCTLDLSDKIPQMCQNLIFFLFSLLYPRPVRQNSQNASKSEVFPIYPIFTSVP